MDPMKSSGNPRIYEINTRVWIRKFDTGQKRARLSDVPENIWIDLKEKGIDFIWLMGLWITTNEAVKKYCLEEPLVKEYKKALKDWQEDDVIGSPYAISEYRFNEELTDEKEFFALRKKLNSMGMGIILDFIPNHFHAESPLLTREPDLFLQVSRSTYEGNKHTYYAPFPDKYFFIAHGRDPFFPAWQDTAQVNYFCSNARRYMTEELIRISKICDGVRCDMAMLVLNNIFENTWGTALSKIGYKKPFAEFWTLVIERIKKENPGFLFIAEAYWSLEWQLQQLGFDYTYDKTLTDRLANAPADAVHDHLLAEPEYQKKSVRFLENHDEERALKKFGIEKSKMAALAASTLEGMVFYHDGQFDGKSIKLPVQLGREPEEKAIEEIQTFYTKLLKLTSENIFRNGNWKLLTRQKAWEQNETFINILAWEWSMKNERVAIIINYSSIKSFCRIKLEISGYPEEILLKDIWNGDVYRRSGEEIVREGLYIELNPFSCHVLSY